MNQANGKISLYYFEGYDFVDDKIVRSRRPATIEFIEKFHFQPMLESPVEVDSSQVDAQGFLAGDS